MGFSIWQLLIILAIVLLLFGAKRLRNLGGDLGGAIKGFKQAMKEEDQPAGEEGKLDDKSGRVIDGEAVLILADSSEVNVLNTVASRIFELSDGNYTVEEISKIIASEYEVSEEQAGKDVTEFILQLVDQLVIVLDNQKGEA